MSHADGILKGQTVPAILASGEWRLARDVAYRQALCVAFIRQTYCKRVGYCD